MTSLKLIMGVGRGQGTFRCILKFEISFVSRKIIFVAFEPVK